jgi:hypothetical protein
MEFINEYGLLIAIATPVGAVALVNVLLALSGEHGTLLLPSLRPYPSVTSQSAIVVAEPEANEPPAPAAAAQPAAARPARTPVTAGFDEADEMMARQAA